MNTSLGLLISDNNYYFQYRIYVRHLHLKAEKRLTSKEEKRYLKAQ
jgi:hypothetical protein